MRPKERPARHRCSVADPTTIGLITVLDDQRAEAILGTVLRPCSQLLQRRQSSHNQRNRRSSQQLKATKFVNLKPEIRRNC
jgi:hypothetical protein